MPTALREALARSLAGDGGVGVWMEQAKLTADDGTASDQFSFSVAVAGDTALVGAPFASADGNASQGVAYVFTRSGGVWSQQARLTAEDGAAGDQLGNSVALAGDTALVGARRDNSFRGAAYVFTRSSGGWSQQAKLVADDGSTFHRFGESVALTGNTALVGASTATAGGGIPSQGAAYVFTRSDGVWSQQAKLAADDGAIFDQFGWSVALAGDTALAGVLNADVDGNTDQGAAYVFTRSGGVWSQQAKLIADDGAANDHFGNSVALAGDTALVGVAAADVDGNTDQGAAYVFTRSDGVWSQQAKLIADDGAGLDNLGSSVALAGDSALVGARPDGVPGAAYVFTRGGDTWSQQAKLVAEDGAVGDGFGGSVALAGDTALVGALDANVGGNEDQGAAYVYLFLPPLVPVALEVDAAPFTAGGNGVFEPGEQIELVPSWRNDSEVPLTVSGDASGFTGPAGATYDLVLAEADYGTITPDAIGSCRDTETCYALEVDDPADRPALHWDATVDETLTDPSASTQTWTLHIGDSFTDVPRSSPFYPAIETLLHSGVTGGCGAGEEYCPGDANTRAQMPVFMLRALLGADYTPPACVAGDEEFGDVPFDHTFCPWIQDLADREIVFGCGNDNYCPGDPVTRAQMSIFLLKTLEGADYTPPECTGEFADVPCPSIFADWIEDLAARDITRGCDTNNYCPGDAVTRAQMAAFVTSTFGFTLYGP